MPEAYPIDVAQKVWHTLITVRGSDHAPLAIRHAPYLAVGDTGAVGVAVSSILYPAGLRVSIGRALGSPADQLDLRRPASVGDGVELARLRDDVASFALLPLARQAEVLACLNCLTEQTTVLRLARRLTAELLDDPAGCRVLYEVARAMFRRDPADAQSRKVLRRMAHVAVDPWVRVAAYVQLGAIAIRADADLDAAAVFVSAAEAARDGLADTDPFIAVQMRSRVARLAALLESKRARSGRLAEALEQASQSADALLALAESRPDYDRLVAGENLKMVLEAQLKAAGGHHDAPGVARWAAELLALDHNDPGAWRDIAASAARCGMATEASLAVIGLCYVGGAGGVRLLSGIHQDRDAAAPPELRDRLHEAIVQLNSPSWPARTDASALRRPAGAAA